MFTVRSAEVAPVGCDITNISSAYAIVVPKDGPADMVWFNIYSSNNSLNEYLYTLPASASPTKYPKLLVYATALPNDSVPVLVSSESYP